MYLKFLVHCVEQVSNVPKVHCVEKVSNVPKVHCVEQVSNVPKVHCVEQVGTIAQQPVPVVTRWKDPVVVGIP